jgi:hypothetical protein
MTTVGDIIIGGASGAANRLGATTNGYVLTLVSGSPAWAAATGGDLQAVTTAGATTNVGMTISNTGGTANGLNITASGTT